MITPNDSFLSHSNLHCLPSFFSNFCQAGEVLQPLLMVMVGTHYLDMTTENHWIYLSFLDSHCDPISRIRNLSFQRSQGFPNNHHEFYDPIVEWLKQSYLESHVASTKLQSFLVLVEKLGADEDAPTRSFQGLFRKGIHQRGKHVYWVVVTHLSALMHDLPFTGNFISHNPNHLAIMIGVGLVSSQFPFLALIFYHGFLILHHVSFIIMIYYLLVLFPCCVRISSHLVIPFMLSFPFVFTK